MGKPITEEAVVDRLRKICSALPGTIETITFGHPSFKVNDRTYVVVETYKGDLSICFKVGETIQGAFLQDPRFYLTPYTGKYGWISLKVHAAPLNWTEIKALVKESHRMKSELKPKRVKTKR